MSEQETGAGSKGQKGELALDVQARRDMMPTSGGSMQPANLGEMMEFARILSGSGMLPPDYHGNPGNVLVAIQMGQELGLPAMQAIQNIAVIKGRPSLWGDAMLAVVRAHPQFGSIQEMDIADITEAGMATCILTRKGEAPHTSTFSIDDAKRAGLWGKSGPWTNYPPRMLMLRARAFACRNVFPDALRGIHSAEEARDIPAVEAVATVKSSTPASIVSRIKARQGAKPTDAETGAVDHDPSPKPAEGKPAQDPDGGNGELSEEDEARMEAAEAAAREAAERDAEGGNQ